MGATKKGIATETVGTVDRILFKASRSKGGPAWDEPDAKIAVRLHGTAVSKRHSYGASSNYLNLPKAMIL